MIAIIVPDGYHIGEIPETNHTCKDCCFLATEYDEESEQVKSMCAFVSTVKPACMDTIFAVIEDD